MFSVLDVLLKKYREEKKKPDSGSPAEVPAARAEVLAIGGGGEKAPAVSVFAAVRREIDEEALKSLHALYGEAADFVRKLYTVPLNECGDIKGQSYALAEKIVARLSAGAKDSLQVCLGDYPRQDEYLVYHPVNVSFLSVELGVGLGWEKANLCDLAVAALLHDLGSTKVSALLNRPERLKDIDLEKIKSHPFAGAELLQLAAADLPNIIFDVVRQEHERADGSGYPVSSKADAISEYAQIIGLIDVYEALGHQRPYRVKYTPLAVMNEILNTKTKFNAKMVKALIERFGVFPVGAIVELNTKEVGIVLRDNPGMPLRPVINIVLDAAGNQLKEPKRLDLAAAPVVYIDKCLEVLNK